MTVRHDIHRITKSPMQMKLRKRTGFGTAAYADACDREMGAKNKKTGRLVDVRRSRVCDGVGVFAARSVPAGTVMTAYPYVLRGRRRSPRRPSTAAYEYEWKPDGTTLDGNPALVGERCGVAHLANDAIHREVTGRDNNCDFVEDRGDPKRPRLHLVTTRAVRRGEELFVSYCLSYWLGRERDKTVPEDLRRWIACHRRVTEGLPNLFFWEYIGAFDDDDGGDSQRLEYIAKCSSRCDADRSKCQACARGDECRLRRVEVRWTTDASCGPCPRPGQGPGPAFIDFRYKE